MMLPSKNRNENLLDGSGATDVCGHQNLYQLRSCSLAVIASGAFRGVSGYDVAHQYPIDRYPLITQQACAQPLPADSDAHDDNLREKFIGSVAGDIIGMFRRDAWLTDIGPNRHRGSPSDAAGTAVIAFVAPVARAVQLRAGLRPSLFATHALPVRRSPMREVASYLIDRHTGATVLSLS